MSIATTFFFIPSFYGALAWGVWLLAYRAGILDWSEPSSRSLIVFLFVQAAFILSCLLHLRRFREELSRLPAADAHFVGPTPSGIPVAVQILVPAAIGIAGLLIHFSELAYAFGGLSSIVSVFASASHEIRWQNRDTSTIGVQLSYFGWLACGLIVYHRRRKTISRWWLLVVAAIFIGNLGFIDRTRPFWILFTCFLMWLAAVRPPPFFRIAGRALALVVVLLGLFAGIAVWIGKLGDHSMGDSPVEAAFLNLVLYGTSGFAYYDHVTAYDVDPNYLPLRVAYPVTRILSSLAMIDEPPAQVLEPEYLPYYTNVGTFLEPLLMDGGGLYVVLGTLLLSFGADLVGLRCLRSRRGAALFFWANLCFASCFAFFVPRFTTTAFWLFGALALLQAILIRFQSATAVPLGRGRDAENSGSGG